MKNKLVIVTMLSAALIIPTLILLLGKHAFWVGCINANGDSLEARIFCKGLSFNQMLPWKPDYHFNGKTYYYLSSAGTWVTEEEYKKWSNK